jgi:HK97 family phage major capsid protein
MATIDDLIAGIEVEKEAAQKRRDKCTHEAKAILAIAGQEGRSNLTPEEDERITKLFTARDQAKSDLRGIETKLENAQRIKAEEKEAVEQARQTERTPAADRAQQAQRDRADTHIKVGTEERTYRPDIDRKGALFLRDVVRSFLFRDADAEQRLSRHMAEERVERAGQVTRAVGTGAFTGLVVPQYLTDMYAPHVKALRPFADICNKHDLPAEGMTVNISRITTGTTVALQATENTAGSESAIDDTLLTENVKTATGWQDVSRQAIERGTGLEDVVMDDLFRAYATNLDSSLINDATTGLAAVANAFTYTDTSPTGGEFYPKILEAAAGVEANLLAQGVPTHVIFHSRRWYWLSAQMTSTWPLINQPGYPPQSGGQSNAVGYNQGARGVLPNGLLAIVDNNVPTNVSSTQDEVYVVPANECHLWEDPSAPVFLRAEQAMAKELSIRLVIYGYYAYSFRRYTNAISKIGGSGLTTPAF